MKKKTVLIVEDDSNSLNLLVSIAEEAGFEIKTASNGAEGLYHFLRKPDYTAVVLDLMMPEVDGLEFLKVIESLYKSKTLTGHGRIIVETALTNFQVVKELVNYRSVYSVRNKPTRKGELVRDLTNLFEKDCQNS